MAAATPTTPLLDAMGGLAGLERVLRTFYDSVFGDAMIGFLFAHADKERLIRVEAEFTARLLGGGGRYTGRPIGAAHAQHPILGGHFERRTELLRQAMTAHHVPSEVRIAWLEHTERLRAMVTRQPGSGCDHPPSSGSGLTIELVPGGAS